MGTEDVKLNALSNGIAIDGFDVVAYFSGQPAHGVAEHSVEYKGKTWRFSSMENAEKFRAAPARFEPQFNGVVPMRFPKNTGPRSTS